MYNIHIYISIYIHIYIYIHNSMQPNPSTSSMRTQSGPKQAKLTAAAAALLFTNTSPIQLQSANSQRCRKATARSLISCIDLLVAQWSLNVMRLHDFERW